MKRERMRKRCEIPGGVKENGLLPRNLEMHKQQDKQGLSRSLSKRAQVGQESGYDYGMD